jgi:MFS family permease
MPADDSPRADAPPSPLDRGGGGAETAAAAAGTPRDLHGGSLWEPLRHRDFALLWGGFLVSHIGDSVQIYAQSWLVESLTGSGLKLGAVALAQSLPRLVLGVFAGVIVDRVDRRRLLLVTQALAMVQSLAFVALVATGHITYGWVLALAAALGVVDTLNLTARVAMMPTLVPRELIGRAVALQALGVNIMQIASPAVAGVLLGSLGVVGCLATNAATFVALLAALAAMRPDVSNAARDGATGVEKSGFGGELREGFAFVRARPAMWGSIVLAYGLGLFGMCVVRLLAHFARMVLGTSARGYSFLALATGLGAIAASLVVTARARPGQLTRNTVGGALVFSLATIAFAHARVYPLAFAALVFFGAGQMACRSAITTLVQVETPNRLRGRVVSMLSLDFGLWSVSAMVFGALSDRFAFAFARRLAGHAGVRDPAHLPRAAHAAGLSFAITLGGVLCLVTTLVLARVIVRGGRDRARDGTSRGG